MIIGCAEPVFVRLSQRDRADHLGGVEETELRALRTDSNLFQRLLNPEVAKDTACICADLNPGTDLSQSRSLFIHIDIIACLQQQARCGQTTKTCARNQNLSTL